MQLRHCRLLLVVALGAVSQLSPAATPAASWEEAPGIIAAQLRRQGVACTNPRSAALDPNNSIPHETVWTLRCDEAFYRVTLVPHLGARITPMCQEDQRKTLYGPERPGKQ